MIKPHQIKLIHTLKSKAGIDEDLYREMLLRYGVDTCKKLTWSKANLLIDELNKAAGVKYNPRKAPRTREMASADQKAMIEGMWSDVSRKTTAAEKKSALNHFLERFGVSHIDWLTRARVEKVVKALVAMGARTPEAWLRDTNNNSTDGVKNG